MFSRLVPKYRSSIARVIADIPTSPTRTLFTKAAPEASPQSSNASSSSTLDKIKIRPDRPALVVSSTSWTIDEDFDLLLDAIDIVEHDLSQPVTPPQRSPSFPKVIIMITGKGPLQASFMEKYAAKTWKRFCIVCDWFEAKDYPKILGAADIGISFHKSSSGMDLPMKVVDMLGSDLPVLALDFPCIGELIRPYKNGLVFHDAKELASQLHLLLARFPENELLNRLHLECEQETPWKDSWSEHWTKRVRPLFRPIIEHSRSLSESETRKRRSNKKLL